MENQLQITVRESDFHGGAIIYRGHSLNQAIRAARRNTCNRPGIDCKCGGAKITVIEDGNIYRLHGWGVTPAFRRANEIKWEFLRQESEI